MKKNRYYLVDTIRGVALINMVLFHFLYDIFVVYGMNPVWYKIPAVHIWQQCICQTFILVSGFVWTWGRKTNLRRGLMLNAFGLIITLVTWIAVPSELILFGILNFIGCAVLLLIPLQKILEKLPPVFGFLLSLVLFQLFYHIWDGCYLGFGQKVLWKIPDYFYQFKLLMPFGLPYPGFYSSDYFPMLPWFFLYLTGFYAYQIFAKYLAKKTVIQKALSMHLAPLTAIGQKSIWIYMAHQPLCMLACMIIFRDF